MKSIVFSDAHNASKWQYKLLLDEAVSEGIKQVYFLGDITGQDHYFNFSKFVEYSGEVGINVQSVRGNHDQAALDYVLGKPSWGEENMDLRLKKPFVKQKFISMIKKYFKNELTLDNILMTHALPRGHQLSGPNGDKRINGDHRFKYRELWHYSFNTYANSGAKKIEIPCVDANQSFDPQVIQWNFNYLKQRGLKFLIKGHEHLNKFWSTPITCEEGYLDHSETITKPAIIQVGMFEQGDYLVMDNSQSNLKIEYKRLI